MEPSGGDCTQSFGVGAFPGGTAIASVGKHAAPANATAGEARDGQIVGTFGDSCTPPSTSRKIERSRERGNREEGRAFCRYSQNAKAASTCSIVMSLHASLLNIFRS